MINTYLTRIQTIVFDEIGDLPVRVFLFGSRAGGRVRDSSDVDIALMGPNRLDPAWMARLRERIEESTLPYKVDLVDLNAVDDAFRKAVLPGGVEWKAHKQK